MRSKEKIIHDYIYGNMSGSKRRRTEERIRSDAGWEKIYEQMKAAREVIGSLAAKEPVIEQPVSLKDRILNKIVAGERTAERNTTGGFYLINFLTRPAVRIAMAACLIFIVLAFTIQQGYILTRIATLEDRFSRPAEISTDQRAGIHCDDLEWLVRHYAAPERTGRPVTALPAGSVRNLKKARDMICRRMQYTDTEYIPAIIRKEILRYLQENNKSTLN